MPLSYDGPLYLVVVVAGCKVADAEYRQVEQVAHERRRLDTVPQQKTDDVTKLERDALGANNTLDNFKSDSAGFETATNASSYYLKGGEVENGDPVN